MNYKNRLIYFLSLLAIIGLLFNSCLKDNFDFKKIATSDSTWNPTFALPIVYSELDVYDVLAKIDSSELVVIDPITGLLSLVYKGVLFSLNLESIIQFPDQIFSKSYTSPDMGITGPGFGTVTQSFSTIYNINVNSQTTGVKLTSSDVKTGRMDITFNSSFQHNMIVTVASNAITKNGVPFTQNIPINYPSNTITTIIDLKNWAIDYSLGNNGFNEIPFTFTAKITDSGNPIGGQLDIAINFNNFSFKEIHGDFGQQQVNTDQDSILIRIFRSSTAGVFKFANPKIHIDIENSFGFPASIEFLQLESQTYTTSPVTINPIIYQGSPAPFLLTTINAPVTVGQKAITSIDIDKTNSNIDFLVEPTPKYVYHKVRATSNPTGGAANNFMTDQSKLTISTRVELPLDGFAYGWELLDTLQASFQQNDITNVDSVLLRLSLDNGFPSNGSIQLYFTDASYNILDSLMTGGITQFMKSGTIDGNGRVIESTKTITDIKLTYERAQRLFDTKYAIIKVLGESTTPQGTDVKIYQNYKLIVRLGVKVAGHVDLNGH